MVYLCDECGEQVSKAWSLDRHVKQSHKINFKCNLCEFETDDKQSSTIHKKHYAQEYFQCEHCNKRVKNKNNFLRHVKEHHEVQRFSCSHCNYQTNRACQLSEHKKTHILKTLTHQVSKPSPKRQKSAKCC